MSDSKKMERVRQIIGDFAVNKGKVLLLLSFLLFIVAAYYVMDFVTEDSLAVKYKKTTALVEEVQETKNVLTIVTSQGFFVVDPGLRSDKYKNIGDFFRKVKEDGSPVRIDYKDVGNDKVIENVFYRAESTKFGKVSSLK